MKNAAKVILFCLGGEKVEKYFVNNNPCHPRSFTNLLLQRKQKLQPPTLMVLSDDFALMKQYRIFDDG